MYIFVLLVAGAAVGLGGLGGLGGFGPGVSSEAVLGLLSLRAGAGAVVSGCCPDGGGAPSGSFPRPEGVTWEDRGVPRSPADAAPLLGCSHGPIRTKMWDPPGQLGYPSSRSAVRSSPIVGRAPAPPSVEVAQFAALVFGHLSRPRSGGVTASVEGARAGSVGLGLPGAS